MTAVAELEYCPRSFWYQIAFGRRKLSNEHIEEGLEQDEARLERSDSPDVIYGARAFSEALGLQGYADAVMREGDELVPVDYKKGKKKESETDRLILCAIAMCLEESSGQTINRGYLYYTASRSRVEVEFTQELRARVKEAAALAWRVLESDQPPPPANDRRCHGCSFEPYCVPDYLEAMKEGRPGVLPDLAFGRVLYVDEPGAYVRKKGQEILITLNDETLGRFPADSFEQVILVGNVNASSSAMRFFMREGIDLVFLSAHGRFQGRLQAQSPRNTMLRIAQFKRWEDDAFAAEMCRAFVLGKLRNMRTLLQRQFRKLGLAVLKEADDALGFAIKLAPRAESKSLLLGIEGTATAAYFKGLAELFSLEGFEFPSRTRRPPLDPVNALLSFLYYLLAKDVESALAAAGLDPFLGFYHSPKYGRPALALDLMEEFRPVIADSVALTLIRKKILTQDDFKCSLGIWEIKDAARKKVYRAYEERLNSVAEHPVLGRKYSARRIIEAQARLMAKVIEGDWPRYEPYTIR